MPHRTPDEDKQKGCWPDGSSGAKTFSVPMQTDEAKDANRSEPSHVAQVYKLNLTQLTALAQRLGIKHPEHYLLRELRSYVIAALRRKGSIRA